MAKSLIILLGLGSLISVWVILSIIVFGESVVTYESTNLPVEQQSQNQLVTGQQVITTWSDKEISAQTFLQNPDTTTVSPNEFYSNSSDPSRYEIYYDEPSGNITVLLTAVPLSFSRQLAETQLKQVLDLSEVELCRLEVRVVVNSIVSEQYARTGNLGLSFCSGSQVIND